MPLEVVVQQVVNLAPNDARIQESPTPSAVPLTSPTPLAGGAGGWQCHATDGHYGKEPHSTRKAKTQAQAQYLRDNPTDAERKLWNQALAKSHLGVKFRRQQAIGDYIVDFVCMSHKLVIELDGSGHNSESRKREDQERTAFLEQGGYRVLRFWNNEVMENLEGVVEMILNYLGDSPRGECPPLAPPAGGGGKSQRSASGGGKNQHKYLIVITGGEPLRHNVVPLCEALLAEGYRVQIETNGTLYQALPSAVHVVCSPKNQGQGYAPLRPDMLGEVDALKFVISKTDPDYQDVPDWCAEPGMPPIYLQPMDEADAGKNRDNWQYTMELAMHYGYKLSLRLHKILDIP